MTREELELALDSGQLFAKMLNGNWWKLRRNGKTKLWKTRPADFRVPVKAGLRSCAQLGPSDLENPYLKVEQSS